jgi:hypothetical protein
MQNHSFDVRSRAVAVMHALREWDIPCRKISQSSCIRIDAHNASFFDVMHALRVAHVNERVDLSRVDFIVSNETYDLITIRVTDDKPELKIG